MIGLSTTANAILLENKNDPKNSELCEQIWSDGEIIWKKVAVVTKSPNLYEQLTAFIRHQGKMYYGEMSFVPDESYVFLRCYDTNRP